MRGLPGAEAVLLLICLLECGGGPPWREVGGALLPQNAPKPAPAPAAEAPAAATADDDDKKADEKKPDAEAVKEAAVYVPGEAVQEEKDDEGGEDEEESEENGIRESQDEDDDVRVAIRIRNKNGRDMWTVSNFLLQEGVQRSILDAIAKSAPGAGRGDLEGLRRSLRRTFTELRDEAVRVDDDGIGGGGGPGEVNVTVTSGREEREREALRGRVRAAVERKKEEDRRLRELGVID